MKFKRFIFVFCILLFAFSLVSLAFLSQINGFANAFSRTVSYNVKIFLSKISAIFPFSLFEALAVLSPIIIIFIVLAVIRKKGKERSAFAFVLAIISLLPSLYIITIAIPGKSSLEFFNVNERLEVNIEDAAFTADAIIAELSKLSSSNFEGDFEKTIIEACSDFYKIQENSAHRLPKPKYSFLPEALSRFGIHAFFAFPTAEIIINPKIPNSIKPFTLAHEYAHFLGAQSEADANFFAFLTCINAESDYVAYSGYLSALQYLLVDISSLSAEMYTIVYEKLPCFAKNDIELFNSYNLKYRSGYIYKLMDGINSVYLDKTDKNGRESYSLISEYLIAYYRKNQP